MIDVSLHARLGKAFPQLLGFVLAAGHDAFNLFDPGQHGARQIEHCCQITRLILG